MDTGIGNEGIAALCCALIVPIAADGHRVQPTGLAAARPRRVADGYSGTKAKSTMVVSSATTVAVFHSVM